MKLHSLKPLITKPSNQSRSKRAAFARERIYGSVTILAVNVGMLVKGDFSVQHAYVTVITTIGGLWLASMFAAVLSYRIVHDTNMPRDEIVHELTVHRGLLLAAVPSLIMFSISAVGITTVQTAIIADIFLAIITMTVTIARSGKTKTNSFVTAIVSFGIQAIVAGLIILIKLGSK